MLDSRSTSEPGSGSDRVKCGQGSGTVKARVFHCQTWASKPHSTFTRVLKSVLKGALLVPLPIDPPANRSSVL